MTSLVIRVPEDSNRLYKCIQYPAGELQVRLSEAGLKAVKEASRISILHRGVPNLMELLLLCDAVGRAAEFTPVRLVLPYLPYARADRRFVEGDCAGLAVFGNALNGLGLEEVVTLDVHSNKALRHIPRLRNVSPMPFIQQAAMAVRHETTILLPDEGSTKRYNLPGWIVKNATKVRDPETGRLSGFEVPAIYTKSVLIVDDICDGGGTFIGIAKAINERSCCCKSLPRERPHPESPACPGYGPKKKLYLYVTHGIFSKGFRALLPTFEHVYTTDSLPQQPQPQLTVLEAVKDLL